MPSMPMLSTPAFSDTCSPRPASSSGMPAVTAPEKRGQEGGGEQASMLAYAACSAARARYRRSPGNEHSATSTST